MRIFAFVILAAGAALVGTAHADFIGNLIDKISSQADNAVSPTSTDTISLTTLKEDSIEEGVSLQRPAHIRILDKRTNRIEDYTFKTTTPKVFDTLQIQVKNCIRHHNEVGHHAAWFTIKDVEQPDTPALFDGWMLSAFPAVAALEHPRYDVRIIECER